MVVAELDTGATDPWISSAEDYGWTVDQGLGRSYVRWGEQVFQCDRVLDREEACCDEEHWYAYRLEKDGQQFYVAGGQALPSYEQVKFLRLSVDHSSYAFAGYRHGQWYVCHNGREIVASDDVLKIEVAPSGSRFAFHLKKGADEYILEPDQMGRMFERIKHIKFSAAGQFLAYRSSTDGVWDQFVLNHMTQGLSPRNKHLLEEGFSIPGNRWACLFSAIPGKLTLLVDGRVLSCNDGRYSPVSFGNSPIFSPDESSIAFPVKTETGDYALCHDGKYYAAPAAFQVGIIGWLPGNQPAWVSCDEERGYVYHVGGESESATLIGASSMSHIFAGNNGSYAGYGPPRGEDVSCPKILVKDGKVLQQANCFDTGKGSIAGFGFSSRDRLSYAYTDNYKTYSLAIDGTTLLSGFQEFSEFHWAPDGEHYTCIGEKDGVIFLIVNSKLYGPFEDAYYADFSNDSRHWSGVMRAYENWIVLLDGEIIDQVDGEDFHFATPHRLFTEDSRWCHYYAIEGGKIVYKRVEI